MSMLKNKRNIRTYREEMLKEHSEQFYLSNLENLYEVGYN